MRIMILANNDVGLYQFRKELIEELLKKNKVFISLPYGELVNPLIEMGCCFIDTAIDRRGMNVARDFKLILSYWKMLKRVKPHLVITYTIKPNVYGGMVCRLLGIPYTVNITGLGTAFQNPGLLQLLVTNLYRLSTADAKRVFFENSENRRIFIKRHIVKAKQTVLLNGAGVNLNHYQLLPYPQVQDSVHFLFVGRVMKEKGINELFEVVQKLRKEGCDCVLDVLGACEENYEGKIHLYEQEGWLNYYGYQKDVRPFIAQSHCFVLPSWHEGMANTNLECAASGRPIITSNIPGCREAVEESVSGFLCESKNSESLYEALQKFMRLSLKEREQMGICGRNRMQRYFDRKKVVRKTIAYLKLDKSQRKGVMK